jgi:hypothetical protein
MDERDKRVVKYVLACEAIFGTERNRRRALWIALIAGLIYFLSAIVRGLAWLIFGAGIVLKWLIGTNEGRVVTLILLASYGMLRIGEDIWGPSPIPAPVAVASPIAEPSSLPSPVEILPPIVPPVVAEKKPPDHLILMNEVRSVLGNAPMYAGPNTSTPIEDYIHAGQSVRVLGKQGDFYVVRKLNGKLGFVLQDKIAS